MCKRCCKVRIATMLLKRMSKAVVESQVKVSQWHTAYGMITCGVEEMVSLLKLCRTGTLKIVVPYTSLHFCKTLSKHPFIQAVSCGIFYEFSRLDLDERWSCSPTTIFTILFSLLLWMRKRFFFQINVVLLVIDSSLMHEMSIIPMEKFTLEQLGRMLRVRKVYCFQTKNY